MKFITETGSIYEVDESNNKIRRLEGSHDPTPRQGPDGEWKEYLRLSSIQIDKSVIIIWKMEGLVAKTTITSHITEIIK